jgi:hypothetical protein
MKCRACWCDKAYEQPLPRWRRGAWRLVLVVPMKCHHCYHRFRMFWPLTWGQQLTPPVLKPATHKPLVTPRSVANRQPPSQAA